MKKSDNNNEMAFLLGFKSRTGVLWTVTAVGMFFTMISLFCPFCSYNPTVIDDLKRNVGLFGLSLLSIPALLCWVGALIMCLLCVLSLSKPNWREKPKKYAVFPVLAVVFLVVSVIVLAVACIFYEIPEESFGGLETKLEAGFYLFAVGSLITATAFSIFSLGLKNLACGKISTENIALGKQKKGEEIQKDDSSLAEKLKELQKLKDEGLITESEFLTKREEMLEKYK